MFFFNATVKTNSLKKGVQSNPRIFPRGQGKVMIRNVEQLLRIYTLIRCLIIVTVNRPFIKNGFRNEIPTMCICLCDKM